MPFRKHGWMRPFQRRKRLFGDVGYLRKRAADREGRLAASIL